MVKDFKKASETEIQNYTIHKFILDNGLLDFKVSEQHERCVVLLDETAEMTIKEAFYRIFVEIDDLCGDHWYAQYEQTKELDGNIVWRVFQ